MKRKVSITLEHTEKKLYYNDAVVMRVHEDSCDVKLPGGKIYKYVQNSTNSNFFTGDYVSVLFSDEDRTNCKIIGVGKRSTSFSIQSEIPVVRV